jgi:hypothetical protein
VTVEEFFRGRPDSRAVFAAVAKAVGGLEGVSIRATRSQVAFRRRKNFAIVWVPGKYLRQPVPPLVLTFSFSQPVDSPRWKEVTKVSPARYTHHLELHSTSDVDDEVRTWLRRSWQDA